MFDLNPIENVWILLKPKIYKLHSELYRIPDDKELLEFLIETVQKVWSLIDTDISKNLAVTILYCVQQIIDNNG